MVGVHGIEPWTRCLRVTGSKVFPRFQKEKCWETVVEVLMWQSRVAQNCLAGCRRDGLPAPTTDGDAGAVSVPVEAPTPLPFNKAHCGETEVPLPEPQRMTPVDMLISVPLLPSDGCPRLFALRLRTWFKLGDRISK